MPKEHKKRGRREEKKRKRLEEEDAVINTEDGLEPPAKRARSAEANDLPATTNGEDFISFENEEHLEDYHDGPTLDHDAYAGADTKQSQEGFYGLLHEDEQAYFKRSDNMLELNQFGEPEERRLFQESVWTELDGKELKVASSQSCSRFLERLIKLSTPKELKNLFRKFKGHFLYLVQHRFSSHCCEALFLQAAPVVTEELVAPTKSKKSKKENIKSNEGDRETEKEEVPMEDLFLTAVQELENDMGYLMTDSFASHSLRVLLIVLSGKPLGDAAAASVLKSKSKENIEASGVPIKNAEKLTAPRTVPESFGTALKRMIASTVGGLDTNYLRALATQPVGNPVMQLLLEAEFTVGGKQKAEDSKSLFRKLLPDDVSTEGTQSASFIKGLLYDPVGSRLLETIIRNAPTKIFKEMYRTHFQENLSNIVRNEVASYVVIQLLERLRREKLQAAFDQLCPEIPALLQRSRTAVIKVMIEQAREKKVDTRRIVDGLVEAVGSPAPDTLNKMLRVSSEPENKIQIAQKRHASHLLVSMVKSNDQLRKFVFDCLASVDGLNLATISCDKAGTYVVQSSLTAQDCEDTFLRRLIPKFRGHIEELSVHTIGSHVLDAILEATAGLQFLRERIAEELLANEKPIKDTFPGRTVWRNWHMDLYKRNKALWVGGVKGESNNGTPGVAAPREKKKTAIELARERYAARKAGPRQGRPGK